MKRKIIVVICMLILGPVCFGAGTLFGIGYGVFALFSADIKDDQKIIIAEYVNTFCHPPKRQMSSDDDVLLMGERAALTRITVSSGLGELAWARYLDCKVWSNPLRFGSR